jgi:hypothetical protein
MTEDELQAVLLAMAVTWLVAGVLSALAGG